MSFFHTFLYGALSFFSVMGLVKSLHEGYGSSPKSKFVFFHKNGCGWCERMKPDWDRFVKTLADEMGPAAVLNGGSGSDPLGLDSPNIQILAVEHSDVPPTVKNQISGYPTLKYYKDGDIAASDAIAYNGDRSAMSLYKFLKDQ